MSRALGKAWFKTRNYLIDSCGHMQEAIDIIDDAGGGEVEWDTVLLELEHAASLMNLAKGVINEDHTLRTVREEKETLCDKARVHVAAEVLKKHRKEPDNE